MSDGVAVVARRTNRFQLAAGGAPSRRFTVPSRLRAAVYAPRAV